MEAVSFDLDGTLVRSTESREHSLEQVRRTVDPTLPNLSVDTYQRAFRDALGKRLPDTAWELPVRRAAFERAFDAAGSVPPAATLEAFVLSYRRRRLDRLVPQDGAVDVLSKIRRTRPVVVVTNGPAGLQQEKLLQTGLSEYVDAVAVAGRCGAMKPDPHLFEAAFDRVGASIEDAIHVGDSRHDVDGALQAGITPVILDPSGESHGTNVTGGRKQDADGVLRCSSLKDVYSQVPE